MTIIRLFTVRVRPAQLCTNILLQPVLVLKHTHVIYTVHRSVYIRTFSFWVDMHGLAHANFAPKIPVYLSRIKGWKINLTIFIIGRTKFQDFWIKFSKTVI